MTNIEKVIVNSRYGMPKVTKQMVTDLLVNHVLNELFADPYSTLLITDEFCKIETSKEQLELALKRTLEKCWPYIALLLEG